MHACGQEYRSAVALDIVPASVTSRPLTSGYTLADFKTALRVVGRETVTLPNAAIVDPAALPEGRPVDSPEFTQGLTDFGYGATVFNRPPLPPEERGKPVPDSAGRPPYPVHRKTPVRPDRGRANSCSSRIPTWSEPLTGW